MDTYRLVVCAAVDYVDAPSADRRRALAASVAVFVSTWSRKKLTESLVRQIDGALASSSRKRSPLRDLLGAPASSDRSLFALSLLEALKADDLSATAARDLERQGTPDLEECLGGPHGDLFAAYRAGRSPAGLDGMLLPPGRTTMLSMYRAKGREFDFVVMVIDPRAHSSKTTLDELRRLYYVSATRARRWLGVLYPPNTPGTVLGPVIGK
jgi:superfamily I DNA/RNA helicase